MWGESTVALIPMRPEFGKYLAFGYSRTSLQHNIGIRDVIRPSGKSFLLFANAATRRRRNKRESTSQESILTTLSL